MKRGTSEKWAGFGKNPDKYNKAQIGERRKDKMLREHPGWVKKATEWDQKYREIYPHGKRSALFILYVSGDLPDWIDEPILKEKVNLPKPKRQKVTISPSTVLMLPDIARVINFKKSAAEKEPMFTEINFFSDPTDAKIVARMNSVDNSDYSQEGQFASLGKKFRGGKERAALQKYAIFQFRAQKGDMRAQVEGDLLLNRLVGNDMQAKISLAHFANQFIDHCRKKI